MSNKTTNNNLNVYKTITLFIQSLQTLIGVLGITGNVLTILVLHRKHMKKYSYSLYLTVVALAQIAVLAHTFRHWLRVFSFVDLDLISPLFCKLDDYLPFVSGNISMWTISLISADRMLTIVYPRTRFKLFIKRRSFQITMIGFISALSLILYLHLPINKRLLVVCYLPNNILAFNSIFSFFNIVACFLVVNMTLDVKMIRNIIASRKKTPNRSRSMTRDRKFAICAIAINISSLMFRFPIAIGFMLPGLLNLAPDQLEMTLTICITIVCFENADLFFIHMALNSIFYREFVSMVTNWFRPRHREVWL